jgi:hypothetical protein
MAYSELLYQVENGVATVTLHRPDKLNAFTNVMMRELHQVFDEIDAAVVFAQELIFQLAVTHLMTDHSAQNLKQHFVAMVVAR